MTGQPTSAQSRACDKAARLSECGRYRYWLGRVWGQGQALVFVMLNLIREWAKATGCTAGRRRSGPRRCTARRRGARTPSTGACRRRRQAPGPASICASRPYTQEHGATT